MNTREDGDFLLIVQKVQPEVIYLNEPGAFVFRQCDGQTTVGEIVKRYMVKYLRADRGRAAYEVLQVLRQLDRRLALTLLPLAEPQPTQPRAL